MFRTQKGFAFFLKKRSPWVLFFFDAGIGPSQNPRGNDLKLMDGFELVGHKGFWIIFKKVSFKNQWVFTHNMIKPMGIDPYPWVIFYPILILSYEKTHPRASKFHRTSLVGLPIDHWQWKRRWSHRLNWLISLAFQSWQVTGSLGFSFSQIRMDFRNLTSWPYHVWLVVWNLFYFPQWLGWWSNLTNSIIFQGVGQPPIRCLWWFILIWFIIPKMLALSYVEEFWRNSPRCTLLGGSSHES